MGLMPLEYKDCITDSPYFRQRLQAHEKELDRTSQAIKTLTKEVKELVSAAKELSKAQRRLSNTLSNFRFECIDGSQTDDEIVIASSLQEFAKIVEMVEVEREGMLYRSLDQIIAQLDTFRKEAIGGAKEGRKKFEKQTFKFYQSQEKYLGLSTRKDDLTLQEADASVEMEQRFFTQASLEYVFLLQEVQERKKFEFVETLLSYMYSWLTVYHQGYEVFRDCKPYLRDLSVRLQRTRENFTSTRTEAEQLKNKMLEKNSDPGSMDKMYTRQGYLFLMEKKAFGTTWTKHYCQYHKESRIFSMIPYNQVQQKITSTETLMLKSCVRRMSETIDKRFCFDLTAQDRDKLGLVYTLQALCEEDRKLWMDAMDGKEPVYAQPITGMRSSGQEQTELDCHGLAFITRAIAALEARGLEDQGLYRLVGVSSKVSKLLSTGLDPTRCGKLSLDDPAEWETKTITSAVKQYFRNLPEPLMTYTLHNSFIGAAKQDRLAQRVTTIQELVHRMPQENIMVLRELVYHLCKVAAKCGKNLMTVSNLGVCFGPTLLRPEEETVAAIMDIKFCNIVVEILIEHFDKIFGESPAGDVPCLLDSQSLSRLSSSSSSSPKSSPPPAHHFPGKHPQPVLQTVVTSFTTSEPQTVHFGTPTTTTTTTTTSSTNTALQRSDGSSNLKPPPPYPAPLSQQYVGVPPHSVSSHLWTHSTSSSSLNSGLNAGLTSHSSLNSLTSSQPRDTHHYDGGGVGAAPQKQHRPRTANTSNRVGGGLTATNSASTSNLLMLATPTTGGDVCGGTASSRLVSGNLLGSLSGSTSALHSNGGQQQQQQGTVAAAGLSSRAGIASAIANVAGAPLSFVNPLIGPDRSDGPVSTSTSSSSESLCSRSSREHNPSVSSSSHGHHPHQHHHHHHHHHHHPHHLQQHPPVGTGGAGAATHHHPPSKQPKPASGTTNGSSPPLSRARLGTAYPPTFRQHMETNSLSGMSSQTSLGSLPPTLNNNNSATSPPPAIAYNGASPSNGRVVRTLYACVGENDSELTFEPNVYLTNVQSSREPGWLEGCLHGRKGLVPENYVEFIDEKNLPSHLKHLTGVGAAAHRNTDV